MNCSFITIVSDSNNFNWVTSTTLIIAFITMVTSIRSLYVWKEEIREKRKYELTKELYFFIEKFEKFYIKNIKNNTNYDRDTILNELNKFNQKLHEILLEYSYITKTQRLNNFFKYFLDIINQDSDNFYSVEMDDEGIITGEFTWESYIEDKENQEILENKIKVLKDFCKREIKEFFLGKDKSASLKRYNAKFYIQTKDKRGKSCET